jgi:GT2 family glycosyltransferase
MTETVAVIIASFGETEPWNTLSKRAVTSVERQQRLPDRLYRIHDKSLHEARNNGAAAVSTDWLCFLDCDDELEPGYLHAMMSAVKSGDGKNELLYPKVRYVHEGDTPEAISTRKPVVLVRKPLWQGNFMVIGTLVRREIFKKVGGFRDLRAYEDWDLWIRCWMKGCDVRLVPGAIYRAWYRKGSRNAIDNPILLQNEIIKYNKQQAVER